MRFILLVCCFCYVARGGSETGTPLKEYETNLKVPNYQITPYMISEVVPCDYDGTTVKVSYTEIGRFSHESIVKPVTLVTITKPYGYPHFTFRMNHIHRSNIFSNRLYCDMYYLYQITQQSNFVLNGIKKISKLCIYFDCDDTDKYQTNYMYPYAVMLERPGDVDMNLVFKYIGKLDQMGLRWYNQSHYLIVLDYYEEKSEL